MPPSPAPSRTSTTGRGLPVLTALFGTIAGSRGAAFLALALTPLLGGGPCDIKVPKDRHWFRYSHSLNRLTRSRHLETLFALNRASDIPVFISLLDCLAPVGREGDTTSELVFDQLKATVPLEYEAPTAAQWAADPAARARVMKLYRDWWAAHGPAVAFAPGPGMFFPVSMGDPERRAAARVHNAWYIASH